MFAIFDACLRRHHAGVRVLSSSRQVGRFAAISTIADAALAYFFVDEICEYR